MNSSHQDSMSGPRPPAFMTSEMRDAPSAAPLRFHRISRHRVDSWASHLQKKVEEDMARRTGSAPCQNDPEERPYRPSFDNRRGDDRPPRRDSRDIDRGVPDRGASRQRRPSPLSEARPSSNNSRPHPGDRRDGPGSGPKVQTSTFPSRRQQHQMSPRDRWREEDADGDTSMHSPRFPGSPRRDDLRPAFTPNNSAQLNPDSTLSPSPSRIGNITKGSSKQTPFIPRNAFRIDSDGAAPSSPVSSPNRYTNSRPGSFSKEVINIESLSSDCEEGQITASAPPPPSLSQIAKMTRKVGKPEPARRIDKGVVRDVKPKTHDLKRLQSLGGNHKISKASSSSSSVLNPIPLNRLPRIPKGGSDNSTMASSMKLPPRPSEARVPNPSTTVRPATYPTWYKPLPWGGKPKPGQREHENEFHRLRDVLDRVIDMSLPPKSRQDLTHTFNDLRKQLHKLVFVQADKMIVRRTRALTRLAAIFHPGELALHLESWAPQNRIPRGKTAKDFPIYFPWDIQADAFELFTKWADEEFDTDLFRYLSFPPKIPTEALGNNASQTTGAPSLDPDYVRKNCNYYGSGKLTNGQWFSRQMAALRDGAHGATQAGIHGARDKGAFSIVLSGSNYDDQDDGDIIQYSGTLATAKSLEKSSGPLSDVISEATLRLKESLMNRKPVRVIRSHQLESVYRPVKGYRYDGEYQVIGMKELLVSGKDKGGNKDKDGDEDGDKVTASLFTLRRIAGQDPIRYQGMEKRPTEEEVTKLKVETEMLSRKGTNVGW